MFGLKKVERDNKIDSNGRISIRFKNTDLSKLRNRLLNDLENEQFAILLGKKETVANLTIIKVIDLKFPSEDDYLGKSLTHLSLDKEFIGSILTELTNREDIDTIIDVHTHPFSKNSVSFSGVDDRDEKQFTEFLNDKFENIHYASIVFSQREYSAREWFKTKKNFYYEKAIIKTQTPIEQINSSDFTTQTIKKDDLLENNHFLNRSLLTLGYKTIQAITSDIKISIVGVGGLGSIIAENLVRNGFKKIVLIDNDIIEESNLNRVVGSFHKHLSNETPKVSAIKEHLLAINPEIEVFSLNNDIYDNDVKYHIADSDWIFLATDNHSSRYKTQELSIEYFVPLISVGVNISVEDDEITDMSGEVITTRLGDNVCLNCLGRINQTKVAFDLNPDDGIKNKQIERGYITGKDIKQPAVFTLNSILANMAVESLINEFNGRKRTRPIEVFENNKTMSISEDRISVKYRNLNCFYCNV